MLVNPSMVAGLPREKERAKNSHLSSKENPNEEKAIKSYLYLPSFEWQTCNKSKTHSLSSMAGLPIISGLIAHFVLVVTQLKPYVPCGPKTILCPETQN